MSFNTSHPHDYFFIGGIINRLPYGLLHHVQRGYESIFATSGRQSANLYLVGVQDAAEGKSLMLMTDDELRSKADRLAKACKLVMDKSKNAIDAGERFIACYGLDSPDSDNESGIEKRLACPDWWKRQLRKKQAREVEHLSIQVGRVSKRHEPYVSADTHNLITGSRRASLERMAKFEAVSDDGDTVNMLDVLKGSMSDPAVRRAELMVRMRGFEDYAKEQGHAAMFYTLTCPSKYHRYTAKGDLNPKYEEADSPTPRDAQKYLTATWSRIRAKLKRDGLTVYGFRVAEPHHDACPHWHMVLFMPKTHRAKTTGIMQAYALKEEPSESGAKKYRFQHKSIDMNAGSATGYIAKYISKNIDGLGAGGDSIGTDYETGENATDSAGRVRSWASVWGIRQFQQIGGSSVSVWRELRRIEQSANELIEQARLCADVANWAGYLQAQGGAVTPMRQQPIKMLHIEKQGEAIDLDTGEVSHGAAVGRYGDTINKVFGLTCGATEERTRFKSWTIQPVEQDQSESANVFESDIVLKDGVLSVWQQVQDAIYFPSVPELDLLAISESAYPWSTVNNCTQNLDLSQEVHNA